MANENKTSGWKIFFYLTPLYVILGYPLYNWHQKINSSDVNLSKNDYGAFSSDEGEIKKTFSSEPNIPNFNDMGYSVNYKSGGEIPDKRQSRSAYTRQKPSSSKRTSARRKKQSSNQKRDSNSGGEESIRDRETKYIGQKKGFLTSAVGKAMKNPKVVKALFNNSLVIKGFMGRDKVKKVLKSPDALADYIINTNAASNFLNNSVVKTALNNPAIVGAVASSKLASKLLSSPAVKGLMEDTNKMNEILTANPNLIPLLTNPNVVNALMQNPETAGALSNLNLQ